MTTLLIFFGLKGCRLFHSINPCIDFNQIFRIFLPQEDLEFFLFFFWGGGGGGGGRGGGGELATTVVIVATPWPPWPILPKSLICSKIKIL